MLANGSVAHNSAHTRTVAHAIAVGRPQRFCIILMTQQSTVGNLPSVPPTAPTCNFNSTSSPSGDPLRQEMPINAIRTLPTPPFAALDDHHTPIVMSEVLPCKKLSTPSPHPLTTLNPKSHLYSLEKPNQNCQTALLARDTDATSIACFVMIHLSSTAQKDSASRAFASHS